MAAMFFFGNPGPSVLTLALTLCIFTPGKCQPECTVTPVPAEIGKRLVLDCSIYCSEVEDDFEWFRGNEVLTTNHQHEYIVTENVTIKDGGQDYRCLCQNNNNTKCFTICVRPKISLTFTSNPAIFGSSVNVTCTAVSYPRANVDTDFTIQHPIGETLMHEHIAPDLDGVIYEIDRAMDRDNGTYKCHLVVSCMGMPVMGEVVKDLIVVNDTNTKDASAATSSYSIAALMMGITLYGITSVQV